MSGRGDSCKVMQHCLPRNIALTHAPIEWKVDMDNPSDTHRHLSHLIGLFPGYAIANYDPNVQAPPNHSEAYTKQQVLDAARISLIHRGVGTGPDADSGWEKMWRSAAWAQFGNETGFYHELTVRAHFTLCTVFLTTFL